MWGHKEIIGRPVYILKFFTDFVTPTMIDNLVLRKVHSVLPGNVYCSCNTLDLCASECKSKHIALL